MDPQPHRIIPAPASVRMDAGEPFVFDEHTRIVADAGVEGAAGVAEWVAALLRPPTGFPLPVSAEGADGGEDGNAVVLRGAPQPGDRHGDGYTLRVDAGGVVLSAASAEGLFRGAQTLRQLLPHRVESQESVFTPGPWTVPACAVEDRARFAWRGAMLDVARHFLPVSDAKQYIDAMALYKLNVLHLHLTDDQGWRIEIASWPALARVGGSTQVGGGPGGFYTRADYAELVRYAAERFITIVPEMDVPGHVNALLASVPALLPDGEAPAPYTGIRVGFSALPVDNDVAHRVIADVLGELAEMTPGPWLHVGGDEVESIPRDAYDAFMERVLDRVVALGKRPVGWEEVAGTRLPPGTLVQHWKSEDAARAVAGGGRLILSPASRVYLDMKYDADTELGLAWAGYAEVRDAYDWDPASLLPGVGEDDVAGVEAPLWTETVRNLNAAFYLAFPRLPAVAEVGWSPTEARGWDDFRTRLAAHAPRWRRLGINYHRSPQVDWDG